MTDAQVIEMLSLLQTIVNRFDLIYTALLIIIGGAIAVLVVYILFKAVDRLMTY